MSDTWTIGELASRAARALRDGAPPPPVNGRVRDVPGERLIRWYMTIGLVDPPLTRRGRIAQYGRRHLLQLVAVKRLQAAGHSIAQIQTALAGATDRMLETAAGLGATPLTDAPPVNAPLGETARADTALGSAPLADAPLDGGIVPQGRAGLGSEPGGARAGDGAGLGGDPARGRFWAERPGKGAEAPGRRSEAVGGPVHGPDAVVTGVRLGDGVRLLLDAGRAPSAEDVQAVLAAAAPLLAVLEERELI
ncbi:helix-turn-helix domain-containing protein [Nonomuraea sp. M3C6]|uniref:Helix-turn-helix domain-containing protein n=1 Tax=Nonomuraea marmarensis TaxID=3351344 RepID=A0ABW7A357_9ACTN